MAVDLVDGAGDVGVAGELDLDLCAGRQQAAELVEGDEVVDFTGGDDEALPGGVEAERDELEALGDVLGDEGQGFGVGQQVGEVGAGPVEGAGERVAQRGFGQEAEEIGRASCRERV